MIEDMHYIPEPEDLRLGFELEIKNYKEWEAYNIGDMGVMGYIIHRLMHKDIIVRESIRVPYLTEKQIENEGWENHYGPSEMWTFMKTTDRGDIKLLYHTDTYPKCIEIYKEDVHCTILYFGTCRCINDFRQIIKLLNIQK